MTGIGQCVLLKYAFSLRFIKCTDFYLCLIDQIRDFYGIVLRELERERVRERQLERERES